MITEFDVYQSLIYFLIEKRWNIVCASPPGGTDNRFRRCLLPRRDIWGGSKGPRDEVDVTAHNGKVLLLAECKSHLSESMLVLNKLGESDYQKLHRIIKSYSASHLAELIHMSTGIAIPKDPILRLVLAVGQVDFSIPSDIIVIDCGDVNMRIWPIESVRIF